MKLKNNHPPGLELAYLFNEGGGNKAFDAAKNNKGVINGGGWVWAVGVDGLGLVSASSQYVSVSQKIDTTGGISVIFGNYVSTPNAWATAFGGNGTDPTLDRLLAHAPHNDNILYWDYGDTTSPDPRPGRVSTDYTAHLGKLTNVALVSEGKGGSFKAIYLNGELANSVASSDGPDGDVYIDIGRFRSAADYYHNGILTYFYIFNRVLSADEIMWLDYDPYGMFDKDYMVRGYYESVGATIPIIIHHLQQQGIL